ncbi:MAG: serine/threonine protein kinase [Candidatus Eremiobacteraeota bacterium]|nr:serine/threonine protein kinase [Candidatus Eremiobacteraeota bacterium]
MNKGDILKRRYQVVDIVGMGGMSEIFLAFDIAEEKQEVILKRLVLSKDPDEIRDLLYSFQQEFKILESLHYPNIPRVYEFFEENGHFYIVEEYIPGDLLSNRMGGLKPHEAIKIILQLCNVLDYLHKHDIIYRDLKPDNIIISPDDEIYLIDFGISRFYSPEKMDDTVHLGTPGYAPPEAYKSPQTDERSDIYCTCALLHQLLTGKDPIDDPFKFEPPHKLSKHISKELSDIVMKGLSLNIENRFSSIDEFRIILFKTKKYHGKFKSYRKKLDKREDFFEKEKIEQEFSKFKWREIYLTAKDVAISLFVSIFISAISYLVFPRFGWILPVFLFLLINFIMLAGNHLGRRKFQSVEIYKSGILYCGYDGKYASLWEDIYAVKINLAKKRKEVTIVTLNCDFTYSENLLGWDHLMKEIQYRAKLKPRHDISGRNPEMEIYEKL